MASSTAGIKRVLVHLQKASEYKNTHSNAAEFTQSILNYFQSENEHILDIYAEMKEDHLLISDSRLSELGPIKMKRPSFCPITNLSEEQKTKLPSDIKNRGIDVGAAIILESSDGQVLLTRRSKSLRTFPGIWVPPGGHMEIGETVLEGGLRELKEETGLDIGVKNCDESAIPILAMWESVYPPKLSIGLPKRHHAVIYLYAKLKSPLTQQVLQQRMRPDPSEVGACAWLDRSLVETVVAANEEATGQHLTPPNLPETFTAYIVGEGGILSETSLSTSILTSTASVDIDDCERVSTGTKFGLSEWIRLAAPACTE